MATDKYFDALAAHYDEQFTFSSIGRIQRERVMGQMQSLLKSKVPLRILELNCGTGTDAVYFSAFGHEVIATDASERMIAVARQKAAILDESLRPQFIQCHFSQISTLASEGPFDLVFSNFGGVNCIPASEIVILTAQLDGMLKNGGRVFWVVMGTDCRWEQTYFLAKFRFCEAFRRKRKNGTMAHFANSQQKVFYHSPAAVGRCFPKGYHKQFQQAVALFIPPSYLQKSLFARSRMLQYLMIPELLLGRMGFLANLADHYSICMKKWEDT